MKNHENSTFYEEKKRYKEVKRRLEEDLNGEVDNKEVNGEVNDTEQQVINPIMFKEIKVIEPISVYKDKNNIGQEDDSLIFNINKDDSCCSINSTYSKDPFEILNILINFISNSIEKLCKNKSINDKSINEMGDFKNNKIETATKKIENLIKLVHSSALLLKNTNDVLYSVLNKMNVVCKNAILNNPTLFGIIENILLKFCEVQDLLDFDQEDFTIETLFEMSKMIYIYKNKVNEIVKSEDKNLNEDYKKRTFDFYYSETNKENKEKVIKGMEEEEAYTDWSTWIESFIEEDNKDKGEDQGEGNLEDTGHELNLAKRKALIRKDDKVKMKLSLGIEHKPNEKNLNTNDLTITDSTIFDPFESLAQPILQTDSLHTTQPHSDLLHTTQPQTNSLYTTSAQTLQILDGNQLSCVSTQEITDILKLRTIKFANLIKSNVTKPEKIGEATFSEVFVSSNLVYKIIPLGDKEDRTPYDVFVREVFIQQCLKKNKGICYIHEALLVKGRYTHNFLKAWDEYGKVENTRPSKYKTKQRFGVIKMNKGSVPLEKVDFKNFNLFQFIKRLTFILCDLEEKFEFEHRDLHWGNILIKSQSIMIIDFTLSRLKVNIEQINKGALKGEHDLNASINGKIVYNDLTKYKWLFEGDASVDEQFEIYRKMRDACKGDWAAFNPCSNFYWVDYLARKVKTEIEKYRSLKVEENMIIDILKDTKTLKKLSYKIQESRFNEDRIHCCLFYK
ncbi:Serine/threonine-protein kinase haspin [Nosema bombycis CQ1]|uniref:non-specific serine/threonine protein kinase n=1 Tax=Nosema bombycis (strain CQ1 / CVCC 102059) TaxID=578461 RepID=R0ML54_NOSB1|nr:Serine/threonine-protein kinase haspin [Nosema bombycis CQ1]|eukprot:EOB14950.1 Serine/threonine-protein kinase haspin [Nosema bombycis CQ1]